MRREREKEFNRVFIISVIIMSVLIISLIAVLIKKATRTAGENNFAGEISSLEKHNEESESVSTEIGKTVEEAKKEDEEFEEIELDTNTQDMVNTQNKKNTQNETNTQNNEVVTTKKTNLNETKQTNASKTQEKNDKIECEAPLRGEIIKEFAKDSLVFSNTLQEWITHNGIDIKADKTSVVKCAANGTVTAIKNDPRYGLTVIINHDNGYQTIYSNLLTAEFVIKGEKVEKGQSIGTVGNSSSFESADEYHLHFEFLKDSEYLDPTIYMNFE